MPIPIPQRPSGYRLGASNAPIQIEVFFDLECPFSKQGWQTILQVFEIYDSQQLYLILQPMTLGNHRQSWDATKAAVAIAGNDPHRFVEFVNYLFDRQTEFANEAFKDKTQTDWHNLLADYAINSDSILDRNKFLQLLESEEIYQKARIPARFAAVKGVWSTPTYFINGAEVTDLSSQSNLADWQDKIDSLL